MKSIPAPTPSGTPTRSKVTRSLDGSLIKVNLDLDDTRPRSEDTDSDSSSGYDLSESFSQHPVSVVSQSRSQGHTMSRSHGTSVRSERLSAEMFADIKPQPISQSQADLLEGNETMASGYHGNNLTLWNKSASSKKTTNKSRYTVTSSETLPVSLLTRTRRSSSLSNLTELKTLGFGNDLSVNRPERPASEIVRIEIEQVNPDSRNDKDSIDPPCVFPQPITIPMLPGFGRSYANSRASSANGSISLRSRWSYKSDDGQLSVSKSANEISVIFWFGYYS